MRPWATLVVLLAVSAGCTTALPGPEARRATEKLEELEARVLQLQRQAAVNELELTRLRQQVAQLEARAGVSSPGSARAASPDLRPRPVLPAPPPIRPELEEDDLDLPPSEPVVVTPSPGTASPPAAPEVAPGPPIASPAPGAAGPLPPVSREAQLLYDQGYTLFHQGRHLEAESRFQEFLGRYPATELSDNAQYWIGAARMARGDHRGALAAFRLTVERYPHENKVPDALFKMGECLEELGDPEGAKEVYRELERRFPFTAAAALALERLELLGG